MAKPLVIKALDNFFHIFELLPLDNTVANSIHFDNFLGVNISWKRNNIPWQ